MGTLGCPPLSVAFFKRGTGQPVAAGIREKFISIEWSRIVDSTSTATVVLPAGSCRLDGLEPLVHDIGILRGDRPVWVGSLYDLAEDGGQVSLIGKDVTWWWGVRRHNITMTTSSPAEDASALFVRLAVNAMRRDTSPRATFRKVTSGPRVTRDLRPGSLASEALGELANSVVDYTTVLREVRVWGTAVGSTPLATITNEVCTSVPAIRLSGESRGSEWTATGAAEGLGSAVDGSPIVDLKALAADTAMTRRYGLIERQVDEPTIKDLPSVQRLAQTNLDRSRSAGPIAITCDLAPSAPLNIDQLVPGNLVAVNLKGETLSYAGQMRIVSVTERAGADATSFTVELGAPGTRTA